MRYQSINLTHMFRVNISSILLEFAIILNMVGVSGYFWQAVYLFIAQHAEIIVEYDSILVRNSFKSH